MRAPLSSWKPEGVTAFECRPGRRISRRKDQSPYFVEQDQAARRSRRRWRGQPRCTRIPVHVEAGKLIGGEKLGRTPKLSDRPTCPLPPETPWPRRHHARPLSPRRRHAGHDGSRKLRAATDGDCGFGGRRGLETFFSCDFDARSLWRDLSGFPLQAICSGRMRKV